MEEERHIPFTLIKEIHRFTNLIEKSLKQDHNLKAVHKEHLDLLKDAIDRLIKVHNELQN